MGDNRKMLLTVATVLTAFSAVALGYSNLGEIKDLVPNFVPGVGA